MDVSVWAMCATRKCVCVCVCVCPQIGTASIDLAPLLRQGRPYSELLVEVPLMLTDGALGTGGAQVRAHTHTHTHTDVD